MSYVDDILDGGRNRKDHNNNLGLVLQQLNSMHLHVDEENAAC